MADSGKDGYELNEVSWWSNWAEVVWLDRDAYLLLSEDFSEYFFNRGGFLRVTKRAEASIETMETEFAKRGLPPHIFVQSAALGSSLLQSLAKKGYRIADQMSVMELEDPSFTVNRELTVEMGMQNRLETWAKVYLESFYGDTELIRPVLNVLGRVSENKEASLVVASRDGKPAGGLALFRTPGKLGVYCVGTVPSMRGAHVASTLLDFASKLAKNEGRKLILQTILSDSVEALYAKVGFRRVYLKELFASTRLTLKSQGE